WSRAIEGRPDRGVQSPQWADAHRSLRARIPGPGLVPAIGMQSGALRCKDGEEVVGDLKDDAGHGRAEFGADFGVGPGAVAALPGEQRVADGRVPFLPIVAAGVPHGLDGVVVA